MEKGLKIANIVIIAMLAVVMVFAAGIALGQREPIIAIVDLGFFTVIAGMTVLSVIRFFDEYREEAMVAVLDKITKESVAQLEEVLEKAKAQLPEALVETISAIAGKRKRLLAKEIRLVEQLFKQRTGRNVSLKQLKNGGFEAEIEGFSADSTIKTQNGNEDTVSKEVPSGKTSVGVSLDGMIPSK